MTRRQSPPPTAHLQTTFANTAAEETLPDRARKILNFCALTNHFIKHLYLSSKLVFFFFF